MAVVDLVPDVKVLTTAFDQADGPTFFLFATAAFIDRMHTRLNFIHARMAQHGKADGDQKRIERYRHRALLLRQGVHYSLLGAIFAAALLAELFGTLILGLHHAYGAALLFLLAILCFAAGLFRFIQETRLAVLEDD